MSMGDDLRDGSAPLTPRDLDVIVDQIVIMSRQLGDMAAQLARAEAINRRLAAECQRITAERDVLAALQDKG